MDFIKKNPLLMGSLIIAVVIAVFLGLKIQGAASSAAEAEKRVKKLQKFGEDEERASYSASSSNLEQSETNLAKTQKELEKLRTRLHEKSKVEYNTRVSNTQCKNNLLEGTRQLNNQLYRKLDRVDESAKYLSFGDVINSEKLPDESTEVPVLMKQFAIVSEIVSLLVKSQPTALLSLKRNGGVGVATKENFELMPFTMVVEGDSSSIKELLTTLQYGSKYFFLIRSVSFIATPATVGDGTQIPTVASMGMNFDRPSRRGRNRNIPPEMPGEAPEESITAKQFQVQFPDTLSAEIRFDFIEFKNPVEEN